MQCGAARVGCVIFQMNWIEKNGACLETDNNCSNSERDSVQRINLPMV